MKLGGGVSPRCEGEIKASRRAATLTSSCASAAGPEPALSEAEGSRVFETWVGTVATKCDEVEVVSTVPAL